MKQVIVVRDDLGMSIGKTAAQVAHASILSFLSTSIPKRVIWLSESFTKIVLKVDSEEELLKIEEAAKAKGVPNKLVIDEGRTEVAPHSATCLGLGPDSDAAFVGLTDNLKLL